MTQVSTARGSVSHLHVIGLNPYAKFVPINDQTNDNVMHLDRRGKADRRACQALDAGVQRQVLALALLRVPLARLVLISSEITRGGASLIRVHAITGGNMWRRRTMKPPRSKLRGITRKGIVCETPRFLTLFPLQGNLGASSEESPDRNTAYTHHHDMAECDYSIQQREVHPCKDKEREGSRDAKSRLGKVGFIRRLTMRP